MTANPVDRIGMQASICSVGEHLAERCESIPKGPGVYAFGWIGDSKRLLSANLRIELKGPGGRPALVNYGDWWPSALRHPCLYVGKSTNLRKRFSQHLLQRTKVRVHPRVKHFGKLKPHTTSCQLRFGIEHVFRDTNSPLDIIRHEVGFSFCDRFKKDDVAERFFQEDRLVGFCRPWFNIDSER